MERIVDDDKIHLLTTGDKVVKTHIKTTDVKVVKTWKGEGYMFRSPNRKPDKRPNKKKNSG